MKVAGSYKEAYDILRSNVHAAFGLDIGKQFGTRIVASIPYHIAMKLLTELEKRDLPLPSVIQINDTRVLIGADPE